MSKTTYNDDPWGGAQVAAYIGAQSVLQRLNCVVPGRWRMDFTRACDGDLLAANADRDGRRRLYLACRLIVTLPHKPGGPDIDVVYEDIGELDAGSLAGLKALYSDARKRAAVAAGIGAYLYTALAAVVLPIGPAARQVQCIRRQGKSDLLLLSPATEAWLRDGYRAAHAAPRPCCATSARSSPTANPTTASARANAPTTPPAPASEPTADRAAAPRPRRAAGRPPTGSSRDRNGEIVTARLRRPRPRHPARGMSRRTRPPGRARHRRRLRARHARPDRRRRPARAPARRTARRRLDRARRHRRRGARPGRPARRRARRRHRALPRPLRRSLLARTVLAAPTAHRRPALPHPRFYGLSPCEADPAALAAHGTPRARRRRSRAPPDPSLHRSRP